MAARFISNTEIKTGLAPGRAVRGNAPPARAELSEQMGELVAQGAIDLRRVVFAQAWIQRDEVAARIGPPRRAEEPRIPFNVNFAGKFVGPEW